ncbi:head GIN domain-containing protein [Trichloromonas sp.]|uniref:head GIN domain-containing protein n=1 Tax=Trichloromonas sp. TaxID=3069249 RepID=UPI002A3C2482|nr:head GIN domain-containing protein [Trichloromonas sp.]
MCARHLKTFLFLSCVGILLASGHSWGAVQINIGSNIVNTGNVSGCVQGSGSAKEQSRSLPAFHALEVDGAYTVRIACQKDQSVEISADDNLLPLILTEVQDGILRVTSKKSICASAPMTLTISVKTLDLIRSSGANEFQVQNLNGDDLKIELSGSSNMTLEGRAERLNAKIDGASGLLARQLKAKTVTVAISGAGSAEVHASERLHGEISGVGSIRYAGNPGEVTRNITGWGDITPLN